MNRFATILLSVLVSGCASPQFTQKNYDPKGGVITYRNGIGEGKVHKQALAMASEFCAPQSYKLVSEGSDNRYMGHSFSGNQANVMTRKHTDLTFICK